jgi:hypothetical protein
MFVNGDARVEDTHKEALCKRGGQVLDPPYVAWHKHSDFSADPCWIFKFSDWAMIRRSDVVKF